MLPRATHEGMKVAYLAASVLHAVFAVVLIAFASTPLLTLTARRQFDNWSSLLDAYRTARSLNDTGLLDRALDSAWCKVPLPPNTTRAPYCACVERVHAKFENATQKTLAQARDDAAMGIVECLRDRPVWRVWPIWSVRFVTPAVYALFVAACFLWIAADLPMRFSTVPIWVFTLVVVIVLMVHDYVHNSFWAFTFFLVAFVISLVILPGLEVASDPPMLHQENALAVVSKTPSCFWWAEYLTAPIFALYVPLMHCGRDLFFVSVFTMIGTAVGGLGLRSFWCSQAYTQRPKDQFMSVMQFIVWLGILAACVSLSFLTGIYYSGDAPYAMGQGSVALLVITFLVSLLQWPGNQDFDALLFSQMSLALVRNIALFGVVISDIT